MASDCNHFLPNLWRPSTCANCYRPKSHHDYSSRENPDLPAPVVQATVPSVIGVKPHGAPNTKMIERSMGQQLSPVRHASGSRRQVGVVKPYAVVELDVPPEELELELEFELERRGSEPVIRVPLPSSTTAATAELAVAGVKRSASHSVGDATHSEPERRTARKLNRERSFTVTSALRKVQITPKRRAPPPPRPKPNAGKKITSPHPVRRNSTQVVLIPPRSSCTPPSIVPPSIPPSRLTPPSEPRPMATTIAPCPGELSSGNNMQQPTKSSPPQKPPRTLSTFITDTEQDALLATLFSDKSPPLTYTLPLSPTGANMTILTSPVSSPDKTDGPSVTSPPVISTDISHAMSSLSTPPPPSSPSAVLSLSHQSRSSTSSVRHGRVLSNSSDDSTPPSVFLSSGQLHSEILQLMCVTLIRLQEQWRMQLGCNKGMWGVPWRDVDLKESSEYSADYKGIPLSLEFKWGELEESTQQEVAISQYLRPHPNLRLVRALLGSPPPDSPLPLASRCLVKDAQDTTLLSQLLPDLRRNLTPADYHQTLLLMLAQILTAVHYLHEVGVCHRDIGLDTLYASPRGSHWEVRLGDFRYALHRLDTPDPPMAFCYDYHELKWLGGTDSRLPPEIMHTMPGAQSLDYRYTDCFSVGCLLFESLGLSNPFETDPELVYRNYTVSDLPSLQYSSSIDTLTAHTSRMPHLHRLANLLVQHDPLKRPSPLTALRSVQVLLWAPEHWLHDPITDTQIVHQLAYDRAALVATLASEPMLPLPPLPLRLKAQFLSDCTVSEVLLAVSLFLH